MKLIQFKAAGLGYPAHILAYGATMSSSYRFGYTVFYVRAYKAHRFLDLNDRSVLPSIETLILHSMNTCVDRHGI